jgi:hypothetical protein
LFRRTRRLGAIPLKPWISAIIYLLLLSEMLLL